MYASRPGGGVVAAAELAQILRGFMHKNMFLICETRESINTYGISLIVGTLQRVVNADAYVSVFFDESDVKFSYCASADHWFRESPYEGFDFSSPMRVECYFDEPSIKAAITRLASGRERVKQCSRLRDLGVRSALIPMGDWEIESEDPDIQKIMQRLYMTEDSTKVETIPDYDFVREIPEGYANRAKHKKADTTIRVDSKHADAYVIVMNARRL